MSKDWFDVSETGIIKLRPEAKGIPEIKDLLKHKDGEKYWQYIWHVCSHKSPYSSYPDDERLKMVQDDFLKENPSPAILKAVNKYRESLETTSMRLLRAAKNLALEVARSFEQNAENGIDDRKEVMDSLGKVGKIIESLDKLEEKVKKEITNDERLRGGGSAGARER